MNKPFWNKKSVVVIGGSGFIGSHFVEKLSTVADKVTCIYRNGNQITSYLRSLKRKSIQFEQIDALDDDKLLAATKNSDVLIQCADQDGNSKYKHDYAREILQNNIRLTLNTMSVADTNHITDVVLVSSAVIYQNSEYSVSDGYILSKQISEAIGKFYTANKTFNVYLPRLSNAYGIRDEYHNSPRIVSQVIHHMINDLDVEIWGNGTQAISLINVTDAVEAILSFVQHRATGVSTISTNERVTVNELVAMIGKELGKKQKIKYISGIDVPDNPAYDISTMLGYLDRPLTPLSVGIKNVIKNYKSLE